MLLATSVWAVGLITSIAGSAIGLFAGMTIERYLHRPKLRLEFPGGWGDGGTYISVTVFVWNDGDTVARNVRIFFRLDGNEIGAEEVITARPAAPTDVRLRVPIAFTRTENGMLRFPGRFVVCARRSRFSRLVCRPHPT
jgi:hypothetical protein